MVVGGILSFILGLIGILNFINTMITSIQARKNELAVLQAVGMTGRQLRQMLTGEGLCYVLLTAGMSETCLFTRSSRHIPHRCGCLLIIL